MRSQNHFFDKNLILLKSTHPELAATMEKHVPSNLYQKVATQSGNNTLSICDQKQFFLHDANDPVAEAKTQLNEIDLESPSTYIFIGLGLGYGLETVWKNTKRNLSAYLLIECDLSIFSFFLQQRDWSQILSNPCVKIVVGEDPTEVKAAAQALLPQIMGYGVQFVENKPSMHLYSSYYEEIYAILRRFLKQAAAESEFLVRHGGLIQRNAIANIPAIAKSVGLQEFRNCFQNQPAVLLSAGPSLTKNIAQLVEHQDRYHIFCVDTAYRIALEHGICPDFVAATDPTELNEKHFHGISRHPNTILLFESDVYPTIPHQWKGPTVFLNSNKAPVNQWIEKTLGPYGTFEPSLSVAHAIFTAAEFMGCNPILLIGFDLAYQREGGETHASGAALNRSIEAAKTSESRIRISGVSFHPEETMESILWVDGVDGKPVPTSKPMSIFLQTLSESIKKSDCTVYDATEGGSLIQGAILKNFDEILNFLRQSTYKPNSKFISGAEKPNLTHLINELNRLNSQLTLAQERSHYGLQLLDPLFSMTSSKSKQQLYESDQWKLVDQTFWEVYRNPATQIILSQALFSAMFLFIRHEKNETASERLKKYSNVFQSIIQWGPKFDKLLKQIQSQLE